jgi:hypothetical protein
MHCTKRDEKKWNISIGWRTNKVLSDCKKRESTEEVEEKEEKKVESQVWVGGQTRLKLGIKTGILEWGGKEEEGAPTVHICALKRAM